LCCNSVTVWCGLIRGFTPIKQLAGSIVCNLLGSPATFNNVIMPPWTLTLIIITIIIIIIFVSKWLVVCRVGC